MQNDVEKGKTYFLFLREERTENYLRLDEINSQTPIINDTKQNREFFNKYSANCHFLCQFPKPEELRQQNLNEEESSKLHCTTIRSQVEIEDTTPSSFAIGCLINKHLLVSMVLVVGFINDFKL